MNHELFLTCTSKFVFINVTGEHPCSNRRKVSNCGADPHLGAWNNAPLKRPLGARYQTCTYAPISARGRVHLGLRSLVDCSYRDEYTRPRTFHHPATSTIMQNAPFVLRGADVAIQSSNPTYLRLYPILCFSSQQITSSEPLHERRARFDSTTSGFGGLGRHPARPWLSVAQTLQKCLSLHRCNALFKH